LINYITDFCGAQFVLCALGGATCLWVQLFPPGGTECSPTLALLSPALAVDSAGGREMCSLASSVVLFDVFDAGGLAEALVIS